MLPTCRSWSEMTTRGCHPARARGLSDAGHPGSCVSWMGGGNSLGILFSLGWRRGSGHEAGWLGKLSHFVYDRVISKAVSVCSSPFLSVFKHFPLLSQVPCSLLHPSQESVQGRAVVAGPHFLRKSSVYLSLLAPVLRSVILRFWEEGIWPP